MLRSRRQRHPITMAHRRSLHNTWRYEARHWLESTSGDEVVTRFKVRLLLGSHESAIETLFHPNPNLTLTLTLALTLILLGVSSSD